MDASGRDVGLVPVLELQEDGSMIVRLQSPHREDNVVRPSFTVKRRAGVRSVPAVVRRVEVRELAPAVVVEPEVVVRQRLASPRASASPRRRAKSQRTASRGRSGGSDPPPRLCAGCGESLDPRRPNQIHHGPRCRKLAWKARQEQLVGRLEAAVWQARADSLITGEEALEILLAPSRRLLDVLEAVA